MSTQALINRYARAFIHCALDRGFDYATVCRSTGMRLDEFNGEQRDFDPATLASLSREIKLLLQDEFCGRTKKPCKIGAFPLMCELMVVSDTLADALSKAFRFYDVLSDDIHFSLQTSKGVSTVSMQLAHPELDRDNFLYEWWFMHWRGLASWLIGEQVPFSAVSLLHHPPLPFEDYVQVFSQNCKFAQTSAWFSFEAKYASKRVVRSVSELQRFSATSTIDLVSVPGVENSLRSRIKSQLQQHFFETQDFFSMEDVAERYHMSSQTLRRHLEDEQTSYRTIKEEIRREVVMKWLSNAQISIGEVARMGGFAEPNGLTRAVKSWIGLSPKAYRDSILRSD